MAPAMAQKSEQEQVLQQAADAAPAVPEGQPESSVASSYDVTDFGGYEAASVPQAQPGEMSEESEDEEAQEAARRSAAYLEQLRAMAGAELAQLEAQKPTRANVEMLESLDGMVGAYGVADEVATAIQGKKQELQEAADDYQRILAELQELAVAAGVPAGSTAAGGGSAASAEVCEGADVGDVE